MVFANRFNERTRHKRVHFHSRHLSHSKKVQTGSPPPFQVATEASDYNATRLKVSAASFGRSARDSKLSASRPFIRALAHMRQSASALSRLRGNQAWLFLTILPTTRLIQRTDSHSRGHPITASGELPLSILKIRNYLTFRKPCEPTMPIPIGPRVRKPSSLNLVNGRHNVCAEFS